MTVEPRQESATRLPSERDVARFVGSQVRSDGLTVAQVAAFAGAEINVTFAARLKFARERENRSMGETAQAAGVSHTTMRNWENGVEPRNLGADVLDRLARFLHVTAEWLQHGTGLDVSEAAGASSNLNSDDLKGALAAMRRAEDKVRSAEDEVRQAVRRLEALLGN